MNTKMVKTMVGLKTLKKMGVEGVGRVRARRMGMMTRTTRTGRMRMTMRMRKIMGMKMARWARVANVQTRGRVLTRKQGIRIDS